MDKQPTTKICQECGEDKMVTLRSIDKKICPSCSKEVDWKLTDDQKTVL